jgi:mycothiol synthase
MSIVFRNYRDDDLEAIVELMNAADAVDQTDEGTSVTELRELFGEPDFHPQQNVFVAEDEVGGIAGAARLELRPGAEQSIFWAIITVHPQWRSRDIERVLLERLWEHAKERRRDVHSKQARFHTYCTSRQAQLIALFESFGLRVMRYSPHMVCQPIDNPAQPKFPPDLKVRPYIKGRDDESALDAFNEAFAEKRYFVPETLEKWVYWFNTSAFREDLSTVALDAGRVVGFCVCTVDEERIDRLGCRDGYVDTLFVRPAYRRRGLGTALLLTGLHALRAAGMESATLDTDIDNPTKATRLYEKVGFLEMWRWVTYGKEMP